MAFSAELTMERTIHLTNYPCGTSWYTPWMGHPVGLFPCRGLLYGMHHGIPWYICYDVHGISHGPKGRGVFRGTVSRGRVLG